MAGGLGTDAVAAMLADADPGVRRAAVRLAGWAATSPEAQRRAARAPGERRDLFRLGELLLDALTDGDDGVSGEAMRAGAELLRDAAVRGAVADAASAEDGRHAGDRAAALSGFGGAVPAWAPLQVAGAQAALESARLAAGRLAAGLSRSLGAVLDRAARLAPSRAADGVALLWALGYACGDAWPGGGAEGALEGVLRGLEGAMSRGGPFPAAAFEAARAGLALAEALGEGATAELERAARGGPEGSAAAAAGVAAEAVLAAARQATEVLLGLCQGPGAGPLQGECVGVLCRHARVVVRADAALRGGLAHAPGAVGWLAWGAGALVADPAARVAALGHVAAAALDADLGRRDEIPPRLLLGVLRNRDVAAALDGAPGPGENVPPPWEVFGGAFPPARPADLPPPPGRVRLAVFRGELVAAVLACLISHPASWQPAQARGDGGAAPLAAHVAWAALALQALRQTGICLTWDGPDGDAPAFLWVALAQQVSASVRSLGDALARPGEGGPPPALEAAAPDLARAERGLQGLVADASLLWERAAGGRSFALLWLAVHHWDLSQGQNLERTVRALGEATAAVTRLLSDGAAEAGAAADAAGTLAPRDAGLGDAKKQSAWLRVSKMLKDPGRAAPASPRGGPAPEADGPPPRPPPGAGGGARSPGVAGALVAMISRTASHVMGALQRALDEHDASSATDIPEMQRLVACATELSATAAAAAAALGATSRQAASALRQVVSGLAREMRRDHATVTAGLGEVRDRLGPMDAALAPPGMDLARAWLPNGPGQLVQAAVRSAGEALLASAPSFYAWRSLSAAVDCAASASAGAGEREAPGDTDWGRERRAQRALRTERTLSALLSGAARPWGASPAALLRGTGLASAAAAEVVGGMSGGAWAAGAGAPEAVVSGPCDPLHVAVSCEMRPAQSRAVVTVRATNMLDVPLRGVEIRAALPCGVRAANAPGGRPGASWALPPLGVRQTRVSELHLHLDHSVRLDVGVSAGWLVDGRGGALGGDGGGDGGGGGDRDGGGGGGGEDDPGPASRCWMPGGVLRAPLLATVSPARGAVSAEAFRALWECLPVHVPCPPARAAAPFSHWLALLAVALRTRPLSLADVRATPGGGSLAARLLGDTLGGGTLAVAVTATADAPACPGGEGAGPAGYRVSVAVRTDDQDLAVAIADDATGFLAEVTGGLCVGEEAR